MDFNRYIVLFLFSVLSLNAALLFGQQLSGLTIIGNNIGAKSLSEQAVIEAFKAKNNFWSNGKALAVCLPETKTSDADPVCLKIYGKTVSEVQKFWLSQVFRGRSRAPHFFETDREMIVFNEKTPGAIGAFVNEKNIPVPTELMLQIKP
jgi:hypothetical protein